MQNGADSIAVQVRQMHSPSTSHKMNRRGEGTLRMSAEHCRRAGQKKAREIWFLARFYSAQEALDMGLINHVVPLQSLEATTVNWYVFQ